MLTHSLWSLAQESVFNKRPQVILKEEISDHTLGNTAIKCVFNVNSHHTAVTLLFTYPNIQTTTTQCSWFSQKTQDRSERIPGGPGSCSRLRCRWTWHRCQPHWSLQTQGRWPPLRGPRCTSPVHGTWRQIFFSPADRGLSSTCKMHKQNSVHRERDALN